MDQAQAQVIALVTENLHRRQLDDHEPISGDPDVDADAANAWLDRTEVEYDLIAELADAPDGPENGIGELVAFAATAVEMWAAHSGHEPRTLVQQIAIKWSADGPS